MTQVTVFSRTAYTPLDYCAFVIVGIFLFGAIFGSFVTPYPIDTVELSQRLNPPSRTHIMGTDEFGRDIFSRVIAGSRISLYASVFILTFSVLIGFAIGSVSALSSRPIDNILMRMTDIFLAFPSLILAIAISAMLGPNLQNGLIALCIVYWPWYARLIRGQILHLKELDFIMAAKSVGANSWQLIIRELLPNVLPSIITQVSLDFSSVILITSALSFVGAGAQPPTPEWGAMLLTGRQFIREAWWVMTFPGLALTVTSMGFNFLGDILHTRLLKR